VPTFFSVGPYRLFVYSNEGHEPAHVHVERDDSTAKFWLGPLRLGRNRGFSLVELKRIERIVRDNSTRCLEAWNAHFDA